MGLEIRHLANLAAVQCHAATYYLGPKVSMNILDDLTVQSEVVLGVSGRAEEQSATKQSNLLPVTLCLSLTLFI